MLHSQMHICHFDITMLNIRNYFSFTNMLDSQSREYL